MFFSKKNEVAVDKNIESAEDTREILGIDRDIRDHEWDVTNFDIGFTDSTCPFTVVLTQVRVPGMDYQWALNSAPRINHLLSRKWNMVDPSRMSNRPTFGLDERQAEMIIVGDLVLMERDSRYRTSEERVLNQKNIDVMRTAMKPLKKTQDLTGQINSLTNPFGS